MAAEKNKIENEKKVGKKMWKIVLSFLLHFINYLFTIRPLLEGHLSIYYTIENHFSFPFSMENRYQQNDNQKKKKNI